MTALSNTEQPPQTVIRKRSRRSAPATDDNTAALASVERLLRAALAAAPDLRHQALLVLEGRARAVDLDGEGEAVPEPLVGLRDVAQHWSVSPCTVWRWDPPSHDVGGRPRYRLSEVAAYLSGEDFKRRTAALRAERRLKRGRTTNAVTYAAATREEDE